MALTVRRGARDPVCGMTVDRSKTPYRSEYNGQTVFFCSAGCKASFDAAPERYVDPAGREAKALQPQAFDLVPATPAAAVRASGQADLPPTPGD